MNEVNNIFFVVSEPYVFADLAELQKAKTPEHSHADAILWLNTNGYQVKRPIISRDYREWTQRVTGESVYLIWREKPSNKKHQANYKSKATLPSTGEANFTHAKGQ